MPASQSRWARATRAPALLSACLALSCVGATPAQSPLDALNHYVAAVRARDAAGAYAWLSAAAKQSLSFEEFQRLLLADPEQAEELLATVNGAAKVQDVRAEIIAENGEVLSLTLEDGTWKADLDSIDLYSQSSPLRALKSFVRAFERHRFDVLLRFVPNAEAKDLTEAKLKQAWEGETEREMDGWVQALRRALPFARAEIVGERASVAYGEGAHVELLNEAGVWKIEAL